MGRQRRLIVESLLLGVVGALAAQLFTLLVGVCQTVFLGWMAGYTPPGLPSEGGSPIEVVGPHGRWLIPLATTLGGLISGWLVYTLAPEAEGHGTDAAVKAFHRAAGFIRARVPPLKLIASAITIGSGGAAGREGPTALASAGIGSIYAVLTRRPEEDRRMLALIGMSAGLSAMFRSPIGAALFAIEVLYSEWDFEAGALLYALLASVVAFAVNGLFVGWDPLFRVPQDLAMPSLPEHLWFVVLGVASGLVASFVVVLFYGVRDLFVALPISPKLKPAIGGLGVGVIALFLPQVLGGGYGWIQVAIDGRLALGVLLLLLFAKIVAFSLTISSGGSGGVFAPSLFVGAMLGAAFAQLVRLPPAAFVVLGMAAVFGGAARVPIATMMMVTEMTGGYHLLPAAALAVTISSLIESALVTREGRLGLYEAQVPRRADSPAHRLENLQAALKVVIEHAGRTPLSEIGRVRLGALISSGIGVGLADGMQLLVGSVRPGSPSVGRPIGSYGLRADDPTFQLLALVRGGQVSLPLSETVLEPGDEILVAATPGAAAELEERLGLG
jgi:CIC family chloride channel protein